MLYLAAAVTLAGTGKLTETRVGYGYMVADWVSGPNG